MSEFNVRPFAFMRLTHEALRDGFSRLQDAAARDDLQGLRAEYAELASVIALHALQEETVFFPTLDRKFDDAATKAGLRDAHDREDALQEAVEVVITLGDLPRIRAALADWKESFEEHLTHEEHVMMPLTAKVAPTLEGRAAVVRQILESDWQALTHAHLPYVTRSLARTKPFGPLRMFVAAVQTASGDRYPELAPVIRAQLSPEVSEKLARLGH